jgi:hypothetical protein
MSAVKIASVLFFFIIMQNVETPTDVLRYK